jgi:hypothetical protein
MRANTSELAGLALAIVALAGLSVAIIYGKQTAAVIKAGGDAFASSIRAATLQSGGKRVAR